jgi:hypothetical protein
MPNPKSFAPLLLLALGSLSAGAAPASALPSQPDTTAAPTRSGRSHSLKLGLQSSNYNGQVPTLSYEWTLGRHLSLQASGSYYGSTWHNSFSLVNDDNTISTFSYSQRQRRLTGQVQARYYFQRHTPALIGWYGGLGISTAYTYSLSTADTNPAGTTTQSDTFVGLDINQTQGRLPSGRHPWMPTPAVGFQLGYRF